MFFLGGVFTVLNCENFVSSAMDHHPFEGALAVLFFYFWYRTLKKIVLQTRKAALMLEQQEKDNAARQEGT